MYVFNFLRLNTEDIYFVTDVSTNFNTVTSQLSEMEKMYLKQDRCIAGSKV